MKEALMIMFQREAYLKKLREYYSDPEDMSKYLHDVVLKTPFLSHFLDREIIDLDIKIRNHREHLESLYISEKEAREESLDSQNDGCCNCPYGNGEGGCTIPACDF